MELKSYLEKIIKDFQEGHDTCDGVALAHELYNKRWAIHSAVQEEYDREDVMSIAKDKGMNLTKEQLNHVLYRYGKVEDDKLEQLSYIIDNELKGE